METLITILILVAYAVYTIYQNYTQQDENRPTIEDPFEPEQAPKKDKKAEWEGPSKEDDQFPETVEPFPEEHPSSPEPEIRPEEYQEDTETSDPQSREYAPYQRPGHQPYHESDHSGGYERKNRNSYKRQNQQAYKGGYGKQPRKKAYPKKPLRKRLKHFDPVQAVVFSEVLNKPKFQELDEGKWY